MFLLTILTTSNPKEPKITQHSIINSIIDYLESKGISTEDIKETQTTILNSGVMVTGGTVNANQMATGTGATLKNKVANAMPSKKIKVLI